MSFRVARNGSRDLCHPSAGCMLRDRLRREQRGDMTGSPVREGASANVGGRSSGLGFPARSRAGFRLPGRVSRRPVAIGTLQPFTAARPRWSFTTLPFSGLAARLGAVSATIDGGKGTTCRQRVKWLSRIEKGETEAFRG